MKTQPTNKKIHVPSSGIPRVVIKWIHTHCGTKICYNTKIAALLTNKYKGCRFPEEIEYPRNFMLRYKVVKIVIPGIKLRCKLSS